MAPARQCSGVGEASGFGLASCSGGGLGSEVGDGDGSEVGDGDASGEGVVVVSAAVGVAVGVGLASVPAGELIRRSRIGWIATAAEIPSTKTATATIKAPSGRPHRLTRDTLPVE